MLLMRMRGCLEATVAETQFKIDNSRNLKLTMSNRKYFDDNRYRRQSQSKIDHVNQKIV